MTAADDVVLAGLAERYRTDGPDSAAWYAIGAAQEALRTGHPDRARRVLDALVELDDHQDTAPAEPTDHADDQAHRLIAVAMGDVTERVVRFELANSPPVTLAWGPTFMPTRARVEYTNGVWSGLTLYGRRVLKDGTPGKQVCSASYIPHNRREIPAWALPLIQDGDPS